MNATFNTALKQSGAIRRDLSNLSAADPSSPPTPAVLGSLSASLTTFSRVVEDYNNLAKQELNPAKQEKAFERVRNFREELSSFRSQFDTVKTARDDVVQSQNRSELLGRRPYGHSSTPENPYAHASSSTANDRSTGGSLSMGSNDVTREDHALREQNFFNSTNSALDEYIARGQAVLGDLGAQREMMKNTQKRLYSVANTLGISGETIRMVERRAREDKWIFWAGVVVFFLFCWLVIHFLR